MKQIIKSSIFFLLAFILPAIANAHDFEVDGIFYNINGNKATVTYKGSYSYSYSNEYSGSVTIPSTVTYGGTTYSVTSIGSSAFYRCSGLTNFTIPNSVTSIGNYAFDGCSGLTNVTIPNSVTSIGEGAFYDTPWYSNQPEGVVYAGLVAYKYKGTMPEGTSITLKEGTTGIATAAFANCTGLTSINIPNSVISIGYSAFDGCSGLTNVTIPNSVTSIGDNAFFGCKGLTNIDIPNSVTSIGDDVFYGCTGLTSVNIGNSVTSIGYSAFADCTGLTSINIPNSVTSIGEHAFYICSGLTSVTIGNSVTSIDVGTFSGCSGLTSINIPDCVTSIGDVAFADCYRLTSITIPNSVTSIGKGAFSGCSGLTNINIPNSVTSISDGSFYGCGLTSVTIGNAVTSIGYSAFYGCNNMTNVYCYAANPPTCFENTFETYSATLHVPASSLAAYFTAPYWCNFESIIGDAVVPTTINISKDSVDLQLTEQIKLTATVTPANASNKVISWHSTNSDIATVENGNVTAIGIGKCDIIATCFGMSDTCHITVANPIKLDQQEAKLLPNHILTLTPTAPAEPEGYTASSSDPTVAAARVMNGKVQVVGIKEGTTTITVGSNDGLAIPATCVNPFNSGNADVNGDQALTITDMTALIDLLLSGND